MTFWIDSHDCKVNWLTSTIFEFYLLLFIVPQKIQLTPLRSLAANFFRRTTTSLAKSISSSFAHSFPRNSSRFSNFVFLDESDVDDSDKDRGLATIKSEDVSCFLPVEVLTLMEPPRRTRYGGFRVRELVRVGEEEFDCRKALSKVWSRTLWCSFEAAAALLMASNFISSPAAVELLKVLREESKAWDESGAAASVESGRSATWEGWRLLSPSSLVEATAESGENSPDKRELVFLTKK